MAEKSYLQSIKYVRGSLQVLDQLRVPHELIYRDILGVNDAVDAIKTMQVRGAPLIAMVGCLGIAVELVKDVKIETADVLLDTIRSQVELLIAARPTAVNMRREGLSLVDFVSNTVKETENLSAVKDRILEYIEELVKIDVESNKAIGKYGADAIQRTENKVNVLTHCNTGSLATCGHGTALGVVRTLHENGKLEHAYFTETRPYNQGSRLTSFELLYDKIPSTMVCDSAVSWLMKTRKIAAVVVGADRVVRNGDTANKIGTYQLAIVAKEHGVPFYIAAPFSSIDATIESGDEIVIEERPANEVTHIAGKQISPDGISVWNPAFDVCPARLIAGIITELGVYTPAELTKKLDELAK